MPYLKKKDRQRLTVNATPKSAGDINFLINLMLYDKFKDWHKQGVVNIGKGVCLNFPAKEMAAIMNSYLNDGVINYQRINDCIGACVCAVYEFIRRNPCEMPVLILHKWDFVIIDFTASWYERNVADYEDNAIKRNGDVFPINGI